MHRYALPILPVNIPLITLLNGGVVPEMNANEPTYFVLTIEGPDTSHPEIVGFETFWKLRKNDDCNILAIE